ncbi:MAG: type II toxin-antitoxin system HipA family toxin [Sulfurovum sp.]|nr:type II toxin-antitoxin system HipA family toxin [Sulfurovum sp.]
MNLEIHPHIYRKKIGTLLLKEGRVYFEYDADFKRSGLEISPLKLPLASTQLYTNSDDIIYYGGLAGVFHDSLPDRFGTKVIERYFEAKGVASHELNLIQKLMFVGNKGMGAISYEPNEKLLEQHDTKEMIEINTFADNAKKVMQGESLEVMDGVLAFMDSAASAGGARAKAVVGYNPQSKEMIYGLKDTLAEGYEHWLLKFDEAKESGKSSDYTKLEYLYMQMASEVGIDVPKIDLLAHGNLAHYMIKRFDRVEGERKHLHSLSGLTHSNINIPKHYSYDDLFRVTRYLTGEQPTVEAQYLRMLFNIMARNQDDHAKNFAFMMDKQGRWSISPAYDITYANGTGYTSEHQLSLKGRTREFDRKLLLSVADEQSISVKKAEQMIEQCEDVLSGFGKRARELEIGKESVDRIVKAHRLRV